MKTKKNLDRRDFIGMTIAGSSVLFIQSCGTSNNQNMQRFPTTTPQPLRIRKNVEGLYDDEKKLFKKVVRTMKDNGMWFILAKIHMDRASKVHGTEFFLPWHRAYLNYFEQIACQLPGCSNFTIPYWDWTTSSRIPLIFGDDPNGPWDLDLDSIEPPASWNLPPIPLSERCPTNPFWKRCPKPNADMGKQVENIAEQDLYGIIGRDGIGSFHGALERGAHNAIHQLIEGNMKWADTTALDPIFWLHHANVDRLWSKWMENNIKITPSLNCPIEGCENCKNPLIIQNWLKSPVNVESDSSNLKVYDLLDNRNLGYIYENTSPTFTWNDCSKIVDFPPGYSVKTVFDEAKTVNVNSSLTVSVRETFTTPEKISNLQNIQKAIFEFLQTKLATTDLTPLPSLLLTMEVEKPEKPEIAVRVFIDAPSDPSELTDDSPSYVGTFSFFESIDENHEHNNGSMEKMKSRHFIFDITGNIQKLESFDLLDAKISVYPKLLWEKPNNEEKIDLSGFGFSWAQYKNPAK